MSFPRGFDPSRCILFLGSGFSVEATSVADLTPPVGDKLRSAIIDEFALPPTDRELKDVVRYASNKNYDVFDLLKRYFSIGDLSDAQKRILKHRWRRIYTTNYDDAVEVYNHKQRQSPKRKTYTISDDRPSKLPADSVVHLHGYIHACNRETVLSELILDHRSYAEQHVRGSPWWDQFHRDIRGAQWVFFLGYSVNDFAVASYLTVSPSYKRKVRFVVLPPVDEYDRDRLSEYGEIDDFAVSGFSVECDNAEEGAPISELSGLSSFSLFNPYKDNKAVYRPNPVEIEAFLTRGSINNRALSSTYPNSEYTIPRTKSINEALEKLESCKTLLLHSRTANGKSVFSEMLALELSSRGGTCLRYRSHTGVLPQEVEYLSSLPKLYLFIPSYDDALSSIDEFTDIRGDVRFIIEMNTGTDQVRRTEVQSKLLKPLARLDLNPLTREDLEDFSYLMDRAGLPANEMRDVAGRHPEMRDLLLEILNSPTVKQKIDVAIRPLINDSEARRVVATACVLKAFGIQVGLEFLHAVVGSDPFDVLLRNEVIASEFGQFSPDDVYFHSAVFSEFFLKNYFNAHAVSSMVARLAFEAVRRKNDEGQRESQRTREARRALGSLMQYRNLEPLFAAFSDGDSYIKRLYETLRDRSAINREPLFWLQYSIYMQAVGNYPIARDHLRTAYLRAEAEPTFRTYQLDTNYLKLILQAPTDALDFPNDSEVLFDLLEKVRNMINAEDHRVHALRVLDDLPKFMDRHRSFFGDGEIQRLSVECLGIATDLEKLPLAIKLEFSTESTREKVRGAVQALANVKDVH